MEYVHPLILNSDDTYNLENVGNEVTLLKKIALRLLSENKVTLMKGTFQNFLLLSMKSSVSKFGESLLEYSQFLKLYKN